MNSYLKPGMERHPEGITITYWPLIPFSTLTCFYSKWHCFFKSYQLYTNFKLLYIHIQHTIKVMRINSKNFLKISCYWLPPCPSRDTLCKHIYSPHQQLTTHCGALCILSQQFSWESVEGSSALQLQSSPWSGGAVTEGHWGCLQFLGTENNAAVKTLHTWFNL